MCLSNHSNTHIVKNNHVEVDASYILYEKLYVGAVSLEEVMQRCVALTDMSYGRPIDTTLAHALDQINGYLDFISNHNTPTCNTVVMCQLSCGYAANQDADISYQDVMASKQMLLFAMKISEPFNWIRHQIQYNNEYIDSSTTDFIATPSGTVK